MYDQKWINDSYISYSTLMNMLSITHVCLIKTRHLVSLEFSVCFDFVSQPCFLHIKNGRCITNTPHSNRLPIQLEACKITLESSPIYNSKSIFKKWHLAAQKLNPWNIMLFFVDLWILCSRIRDAYEILSDPVKMLLYDTGGVSEIQYCQA